MEDDEMFAQKLVDGIMWLGDAGRRGALLIEGRLSDEHALTEAMGWLEDIEQGKEL